MDMNRVSREPTNYQTESFHTAAAAAVYFFEKLIVAWLADEISLFVEPQGLLTRCVTAPNHSLRCVLTLSTSVCIGLPSGLFFSEFLCISCIAHAHSPTYSFLIR